MRKEVSASLIAGIIVAVVVILAVAGYFVFRAPAASGPISKQDVKANNDPINDGKMGPKSEKNGSAIPPTNPGAAFPTGK